MNPDVETDEATFLHNHSETQFNIDQETIHSSQTHHPSAQQQSNHQQDPQTQTQQIEVDEDSIFATSRRPSNRRRKRKMNWGDLKDLIFGIFVLFYAISVHGKIPGFSITWCVIQLLVYYFQMHEYAKLSFRIFMSLWGLSAFISDQATLDQIVYVCINVNQFWTLLPLLCMGVTSIGLMICFSFSICFLKMTQILSSYILQLYDRFRYARKIHEISYSNMSEDENIECSICLDSNGKVSIQECSHKFHPQCIKKWLQSHRTCPVCRKQLY